MAKAPKNWRNVGYLLPEVIDPEDNICICVPIPKDWGHIRAFLGQLTELAKWQAWQPDGATGGRDAARRWFDIVECVAEEINCKMTGNCGCNDEPITNQRYTADGHLEVSHDGGETWENADELDPRFNSPVWIGIPGADGTDKKCQAANAIITTLKDEKDKSSDILGAAGGFTDLVVSVSAFVAATGVGLVVGAVIAVIGAILHVVAGAGQAIFDDSFDDEVWSDLLCALVCNMEADGSFTETGWQSVKSETRSGTDHPSTEWLAGMIDSVGPVGLTNLGRSGRTGALDCDGCDCPGACNDEDLIVFGTVTDVGTYDGHPGMEVEAVFESGGYVVRWGQIDQTVPPNQCCYHFAVVVLEGSINSSYWTDCDGVGHFSPSPQGHNLGHFDYYFLSPAKIRILFGA